MQSQDLIGNSLDWAVAWCEQGVKDIGLSLLGEYNYSNNWALAGPIIEREILSLIRRPDGQWTADNFSVLTRPQHLFFGPTPLVAAMRCYVCSRIGYNVDIPKDYT